MKQTRNTAFSYRCNGCGRCCFNKRIQVNPYEILRLATYFGLLTGDFLRRYIDHEGPYLRVTDEGTCVFLKHQGCSVHPDRPLVCRVYPLGRHVTATGEETFVELTPHPQTEGVYGEDSSIGEFLDQQGALPYMAIADRYQSLFYRMFDMLQHTIESDFDTVKAAPEAMLVGESLPAFMEWLDVDQTVGHYCNMHHLKIPADPAEKAQLHIAAIDAWLDELTGGHHEA